jgi:hypothetical protein
MLRLISQSGALISQPASFQRKPCKQRVTGPFSDRKFDFDFSGARKKNVRVRA